MRGAQAHRVRGNTDRAAGEVLLVGRSAELHQIAAARTNRTARDRAGAPLGGVVIVGEPGVGKSELARAALAEAEAAGAATASIYATQASQGVPLGAFAHLLPATSPNCSPLELLQLISGALERLADSRPMVIAIDDAEHLDPLSATLVHRLAATQSAFVIVALGQADLAADAIVGLWKDGHATRLDLDRLDRRAVGELCRAMLGGEIERGTFHRLWEASRGNPLFLRELLADGLERDVLTGPEGIWRWRGPLGAPPRLRELVERLLAELEVDARRALETLAFGEPLGVDLLETLAGPEAVSELDDRGLLRVVHENSFTYLHIAEPLYGEVLRASVTPLRARSIQRQLADAVDNSDVKGHHNQAQLARWRLEGGGRADPEDLVEAALLADATFDFELSERLASRAIDLGSGIPARRLLASALRGQGRAVEAEEVWAGLQDTACSEVDLIDIAFGRSMNLLFSLGSAVDADRVLDEADQQSSTDTARDSLATQRALIALYGGQPRDALRVAQPVFAATGQSSLNKVYAAVSIAPALASTGCTQQAHEVVDEALPLAFEMRATEDDGVDGTQLAGLLLAAKFLAFQVAGDVAEAHSLAEVTHGLAIEVDSHDGIAALGCAMGLSHLSAGRPRSAAMQLREAAVLLRDHDRNRYLPWCLAALSHAQTLLGEHAAASESLRDSDAMRNPGLQLFNHEVERARACLAAASGEIDEACRILRSAADVAEAAGQLGFAVPLLHDIVRLGRCDASLVERLRTVAEGTDTRAGARAVAHADAVMSGDGATLEEIATQFDECGATLAAAEILAHASACHRQAGRAEHAMIVAERARELLERCEGANPPGFTLLTTDAPALTPREREIASLAADGLTSRVIAERLFISVRTVDNHLHNAYDKLRVRSRRELAVLLGSR